MIPDNETDYDIWITNYDTPSKRMDYIIQHQFTVKELTDFYQWPTELSKWKQFMTHNTLLDPYAILEPIKDLFVRLSSITSQEDCHWCYNALKKSTLTQYQVRLCNTAFVMGSSDYLPVPPLMEIVTQMNNLSVHFYDFKKKTVSSKAYPNFEAWWYKKDFLDKVPELLNYSVEELFAGLVMSFYTNTHMFILDEDKHFINNFLTEWLVNPDYVKVLSRFQDNEPMLTWFDTMLTDNVRQQFFQNMPINVLREYDIWPWGPVSDEHETLLSVDNTLSYMALHNMEKVLPEMTLNWS